MLQTINQSIEPTTMHGVPGKYKVYNTILIYTTPVTDMSETITQNIVQRILWSTEISKSPSFEKGKGV